MPFRDHVQLQRVRYTRPKGLALPHPLTRTSPELAVNGTAGDGNLAQLRVSGADLPAKYTPADPGGGGE